jgi:hypothetical protein
MQTLHDILFRIGRDQKSLIDQTRRNRLHALNLANRVLDLLSNNLMPAKCHIRLQAIFENLKIAMLFFGLLKLLSLESDIFCYKLI